MVPAADDDDDEDLPLLPGLPARYEARSGKDPVVVERFDPIPTFLLAPGEVPDPRLPATGWSVTWRGLLMIRSPGEFRFAASANGEFSFAIDGKDVLKGEANDPSKAIDSEPTELEFGQHPIEIRFKPSGPGARLQFFWESETFAREPLPHFALGHTLQQHGVDPDRFPAGQLLVEEHSCTACHLPSDRAPLSASLAKRPGPHLTASGSRTNAAWIYHWLGDPQSFRPEAVMPKLFGDDRSSAVQRFAVAKYLAGRGTPPREPRLDDGQRQNWPRQGQALFESLGCAVCHEKHGDTPARATLAGLGQKTTLAALALFLRNPGAVDPGGRMPAFHFARGDEPHRLAMYLIERDAAERPRLELPETPSADEVRTALASTALPKGDVEKLAGEPLKNQLQALAREVLRVKRCAACHELQTPSEQEIVKPAAAEHDFAAICRKPEGGCLSSNRKSAGDGVPVFGPSLHGASRDETGAGPLPFFLAEALRTTGAPAPTASARLTLARLNCTGCHERNGAGGLPEDLVARMLTNQDEQNAESVSPPPLTGISGKLLSDSIRQVLDGNQRSRPWMGLQMPRFDGAQTAALPAHLAADDGAPLRNEPFQPPADPALIDAGRTLVGEKGFSCAKCHDMLGIASQGTRGPDLANVTRRVSYDWYERWMTDPQRLQPGTRMPTVFFGGKSPYPHILDGIPDQQRLAIWQYLLVCKSLPLPDGLKLPGKLQFPPTDTVQIVRTFLPDVSARSMALRSPQGIHLAFDAQACRLSYGWTGEFLDMRPVWDGRGGNKAVLEGSLFWTAPPGFPWEVTPSAADAPDFSKRGSDTSLGAILPEDGKLYPSRLNFKRIQPLADRTILTYELELDREQTGRFVETIAVFRNELATGLSRDINATAPAGAYLWFHAAVADESPVWVTADGKDGIFDGSPHGAPGSAVVKVVVDGKRLVLHQRNRSTEGEWLAFKQGDKWSLILRTPVRGTPATAELTLVVLKPLDDQLPTTERVATQELRE